MPLENATAAPTPEVPEASAEVGRGCHRLAVVLGPRHVEVSVHREDLRPVARHVVQDAVRCERPNPHRPVGGARDDQTAIRSHFEAGHLGPVRPDDLAADASVEVPDLNGALLGACEDEAGVEREADACHGHVALEQQDAVPDLHVPHAGRAVRAARDKVHRIGAELHASHVARVSPERHPPAASRLIERRRHGNEAEDRHPVGVAHEAVAAEAVAARDADAVRRGHASRVPADDPALVYAAAGLLRRAPEKPVSPALEGRLQRPPRRRLALIKSFPNPSDPLRDARMLVLGREEASDHLRRQDACVDVRQAAADAHLKRLEEEADFRVGLLHEVAPEVHDGGGDAVRVELLLQPERVAQQLLELIRHPRLRQMVRNVVHVVPVVRDLRRAGALPDVHLDKPGMQKREEVVGEDLEVFLHGGVHEDPNVRVRRPRGEEVACLLELLKHPDGVPLADKAGPEAHDHGGRHRGLRGEDGQHQQRLAEVLRHRRQASRFLGQQQGTRPLGVLRGGVLARSCRLRVAAWCVSFPLGAFLCLSCADFATRAGDRGPLAWRKGAPRVLQLLSRRAAGSGDRRPLRLNRALGTVEGFRCRCWGQALLHCRRAVGMH
mmetsp:Transcript_20666/g.49201  ORF Transcript_20666/g.49201 Transcript_20666/m.49201 type:complete len:609 (-) Transcript_20666:708-2534(-)